MRVARKCPSGKQWSYVTLADAQGDLVRVQREIRERDAEAKVPERAYPCDLCKFWHLTSESHPPNAGRARTGKLWRRR
jgi:hypothetical protein